MTFGVKRVKHLLFHTTALGVMCVGVLLLPQNGAGIQTSPVSKTEHAAGFTIEQLINAVSLNPIEQVNFEEIYVSHFLTAPIKKSGRLTYKAPSKFEKHVLTPTQESFVIDQDTVQYHNRSEGLTQTLSLQDVPSLKVLILGLRSIFTRDLSTLEQYYQLKLSGTPHQWTLKMVPRDEELQDSVRFIRFGGKQNRIQEIEIHEGNGDHSTLVLREL